MGVRDYVDLTYGHLPRTEYPGKLVREMLRRHATDSTYSVLDVGYGRGEHLAEFVAQGFRAFGVDACKHEIAGATVWQGNLDNIVGLMGTVEEARFDLVWCKSVIEHMRYPEDLIRNIATVLAPGGIAITLTPPIERCGLAFYGDFQHRSPFTLASLREIHEWAGLDIVDARYFYQVPVTWRHRWLLWPLRLLRPLARWSKSIEFAQWQAAMALVVARKPQ